MTENKTKYNIIYADPAWHYHRGSIGGVYQDGGRGVRTVAEQYSMMDNEDIKNLPIKKITANDAILFMWVTDSHLEIGLEVIKSWGFKYKTIGFVWKKITKNNKVCANVGAWTMKNTEICLIGTKGNMAKYKQKRNIYQLIEAERTKHSKKPKEARERIVEIFGDLPRVELFAREKVAGWDSWGNEIESDVQFSKSA